jgi:hypothetical protein
VRADLRVYDHSGQEVKEDPRRQESYAKKVLEELGFGDEPKRTDLDGPTLRAVREVLARKAAALWLADTPRTTVRHVAHDTVPTGPPVRTPPHNLRGDLASWVDDKLEEEVARGQLTRGTSPWGSPPFPTREGADHKRQRKRRLVVDYRRVNARTARAVYYIRRASDVVTEAAGSLFLTMLDAVSGFNQIVNTERARRMLAIVSRSGQFLPRCLTFGPHNGPEDFAYVIDRVYSPGKRGKRRFCSEWLGYVDDLTIRTGRMVDGVMLTDEEVATRVREASRRGEPPAQPAAEALEGLGFEGSRLGEERGKKPRRKSGRRRSRQAARPGQDRRRRP